MSLTLLSTVTIRTRQRIFVPVPDDLEAGDWQLWLINDDNGHAIARQQRAWYVARGAEVAGVVACINQLTHRANH